MNICKRWTFPTFSQSCDNNREEILLCDIVRKCFTKLRFCDFAILIVHLRTLSDICDFNRAIIIFRVDEQNQIKEEIFQILHMNTETDFFITRETKMKLRKNAPYCWNPFISVSKTTLVAFPPVLLRCNNSFEMGGFELKIPPKWAAAAIVEQELPYKKPQ